MQQILGASSAKLDHVNDEMSRDSDDVSLESVFGDNVEVERSTAPQDNDNNHQVGEAAIPCQINAADHFCPQSLPAFISGPGGGSNNVCTVSVASAK
jgi:hypothetical protein